MAKTKGSGSLNNAAKQMGERGGPARAAKLSPGRREQIAAKGGRAKAAKYGK